MIPERITLMNQFFLVNQSIKLDQWNLNIERISVMNQFFLVTQNMKRNKWNLILNESLLWIGYFKWIKADGLQFAVMLY